MAGAGVEVLRKAGHMPAFVELVEGFCTAGSFLGALTGTGVTEPEYSSFLKNRMVSITLVRGYF